MRIRDIGWIGQIKVVGSVPMTEVIALYEIRKDLLGAGGKDAAEVKWRGATCGEIGGFAGR